MLTPEQQTRADTMASIRHSSELDGGRSSDAARAIQDLWIAGEIDTDELVRRTRALHGLPPQPGDSDCPAVDVDQADVDALVDHFLPEAVVDLAVSVVRQDDPQLDRLTAGLDPGDAEQVRRFGAFLKELGNDRDDADRRLAVYRKHYPEDAAE